MSSLLCWLAPAPRIWEAVSRRVAWSETTYKRPAYSWIVLLHGVFTNSNHTYNTNIPCAYHAALGQSSVCVHTCVSISRSILRNTQQSGPWRAHLQGAVYVDILAHAKRGGSVQPRIQSGSLPGTAYSQALRTHVQRDTKHICVGNESLTGHSLDAR